MTSEPATNLRQGQTYQSRRRRPIQANKKRSISKQASTDNRTAGATQALPKQVELRPAAGVCHASLIFWRNWVGRERDRDGDNGQGEDAGGVAYRAGGLQLVKRARHCEL